MALAGARGSLLMLMLLVLLPHGAERLVIDNAPLCCKCMLLVSATVAAVQLHCALDTLYNVVEACSYGDSASQTEKRLHRKDLI